MKDRKISSLKARLVKDRKISSLNVMQDSRESPQTSFFRAIELKERLFLGSKESGSDQCSPEVVQRKLLRLVSTHR